MLSFNSTYLFTFGILLDMEYSKKLQLQQRALELKNQNAESPEFIAASLGYEIQRDVDRVLASTSEGLLQGVVDTAIDISDTSTPNGSIEQYVVVSLANRTSALNQAILELLEEYKRDIQCNTDQYLSWSLQKRN